MKAPLWAVAVGGAVLAPLVTWLPMLANRFPALGLPPYPLAQGIDLWSMQVFWLVVLSSIAVMVGASDRWLGLAVAVAGVTVFYRGALMDPTHSVLFAFGALLLIGIRQAPEGWHAAIRWTLIGVACFEAAYALQQRLGYDLLWGPMLGGTLVAIPQMIGTLGTVNATAGYLAIVAPLMPWPLLIPVVAVIYLSHSLGACAALLVGLVVKFRDRWYAWVGASLALGAAAFVFHRQTHSARLSVWQFGLDKWAHGDPVLGFGLGGWGQRIPAFQQQLGFQPMAEMWQEAHSEPIQWVVETGLVGLLLLVMWCWTHREMVLDPVWGGSVAALFADSMTWFPFHIVPMALLGLIVVGLASRPKEPSCAAA